MKLFPLTTLVAAFPSIHQIVRLPYAGSICFFVAFVVLTYLGHVTKLKLIGYFSFSGSLVLSAIMGGHYTDLKGVGGTIIPEVVVGSIGTLLIIFEILKPSIDS